MHTSSTRALTKTGRHRQQLTDQLAVAKPDLQYAAIRQWRKTLVGGHDQSAIDLFHVIADGQADLARGPGELRGELRGGKLGQVHHDGRITKGVPTRHQAYSQRRNRRSRQLSKAIAERLHVGPSDCLSEYQEVSYASGWGSGVVGSNSAAPTMN